VASLLIVGICAAAKPMPITMIAAKISRRTSRSRVVATGDRSPTPTAWVSLRPRRERAWSTSSAIRKAIRMYAPAAIQSLVSTAAV